MKKKVNQKSVGKGLFQTVAPTSNKKKSTEYGKQLRDKHEVKKMYGMREAQFRRFFMIAKKSLGKFRKRGALFISRNERKDFFIHFFAWLYCLYPGRCTKHNKYKFSHSKNIH